MPHQFTRVLLYPLLLTTVATHPLSSVHAAEFFGKIFGSETPDPRRKLTLLAQEFTDKTIPNPVLQTNTAFVSPQTFQTLFGTDTSNYRYLRLYSEYMNKKEEGIERLSLTQGIIAVKPYEGVPLNTIAMTSPLREMLLSLERRHSKNRSPILEFLPIIDESLEPVNRPHFDIEILGTPNEGNTIILYNKVLQHQLRRKFQYLPITSAMNGLPFIFSREELTALEPTITGIKATLKGYQARSGCIDSSTNMHFELTNELGYRLEQYGEPQSTAFRHLIKEQTKPMAISYPHSRVRESHSFHSASSLSELMILPPTPEPSLLPPQIRQLNLNFKELGIGGLDSQLQELVRRSVLSRGVGPEVLQQLDIKEHTKGILLYGPPGNGKTLIARKITEMLGVPEECFIVINGPEVLSKYVGESEENIRKLFAVAEQNPSKLIVIFFDEIDALASRRSAGAGAGDKVNNNMVNQLLSKMDGVKGINNVLVIGATNRLDIIDPALLRPGRFSVQLNIKLPNAEGRRDIFNIHLKQVMANGALSDVDLEKLVESTQNFTGAEIKGLCDEARNFTLQEAVMDPKDLSSVNHDKLIITMDHFFAALELIHPAFGQHFSERATQLPDRSLPLPSQNVLLKKMLFNLKAFRPGKVSSILLTGVDGSGKSALAGRFVDETKKYFDLTRIISPDILKKPFIEQLENLWQDAQSVDKALIVLDGLESLLKILNEYKYDDRAMTILNTMLTSQTKGKIVVLSTMDHDSAELFERINPTSKWSMKATITDLSTKDMEEILRAQRIKGEIIAPLFQNLPISKVLDILNIDDAPTFTYEDWSERITMLT